MPPIRFCLATTFYPPGSSGADAVQVERLAHLLAGRGHDVTVVHAQDARQPLATRPSARRRAADGPIKVIPIRSPAGRLSPLSTSLSGRPLLSRRRLDEALHGPYDVMHFHNPSLLGGPGVFGMGQASLRLYTAHEHWLLSPSSPQLWRRGNFLERSMTELDAVIAPSRTSAELHRRFADIVPIEHIPHFVPPAPQTNGFFRPDRPYFLFVARSESVNGLRRLIDAFRRRGGEDLLIAGQIPETGSLRATAADLPHVRSLGHQESGKLDFLYRNALAVVVPTLGHESFGLVAVEAFSRGTPAIVRGVGALAELIDDSGAGFAYNSERDLHRGLDLVAGDPAVRATLGDAGRAAHVARWTPELHFAAYMELIEELAAWRGADALARSAADAHGDAREGRLVEMELLR